MPTLGVELPENWITPEMLEWARKEVGLDVEEVASKANLDATRIRAWEVGEDSPSLANLEDLSELYDCPVGYFFLNSPPAFETVSLDYRGLAQNKEAQLSYATRRGLREFLRLVSFASSLIEEMDIEWNISLTKAEVSSPVEDVVKVATKSLGITNEKRMAWSSSHDTFNGWRSAIENQGVLVLSLRLTASELRGASFWNPPNPPAILVNHSDIETATGRTFTLLHEYAHLTVRRPGVVCDFRGQRDRMELERFANRFAAETLVPISSFKDVLRQEGLYKSRPRWGDKTLDKLRAPFGASRDVVAILLQELGLAPENFYAQKRVSWEKRKQFFSGTSQTVRRTKIQQKIGDFGSNFSGLLLTADENQAISKLDLAGTLDIPVERIPEFVGEVRRK